MGRPRKQQISLLEAVERIKAAGIRRSQEAGVLSEEEQLLPLEERVQQILGIIRSKPAKATEMTYMIMYDITDNKVRLQVSKYLKSKGCIRIQKSVFLAHTENRNFQEIYEALQEINSYYENADSIILVPVNASDVRSMKLIGKNVNIEAITDKPNTLFF